jgi:hypothetical protein
VSVPKPTAQKLAATAEPVPPLDPSGLRRGPYGLRVCPPNELTLSIPDASSCRLAFPKTTAPASRSRRTWNASSGGRSPANAIDQLGLGGSNRTRPAEQP